MNRLIILCLLSWLSLATSYVSWGEHSDEYGEPRGLNKRRYDGVAYYQAEDGTIVEINVEDCEFGCAIWS